MAYFYELELILAGVILLTAMTFVGLRLWLKRRAESVKTQLTDCNFSNNDSNDKSSIDSS